MKRLLFVIYSYTLGGGAEKILSNIVSNLDKDKYDVTILPYADYNVKNEITSENVTVLPGIVNMDTAGRFEKIIKYFFVHFMPEVLRHKYIRENYDVEISFNYQIPSFLVKEKGNTKVVEWNHGDIYDLRENGIKLLLQKRSYKRATKIVAISENTKKSIIDIFPQFESKIELIYNGVNISQIDQMASESTEITLQNPSILFVGRLEEAKNPMALLEVVKKIKEKGKKIYLYYIGQGVQAAEIESKIAEFDLQNEVQLLGYQNNPYPIMKQCSAVCMLSKSEGFPTVLTEAMALGKPFVSSPVGGVKELSDNGNCGKIASDIDECVSAIEQVVFDIDNIRRWETIAGSISKSLD